MSKEVKEYIKQKEFLNNKSIIEKIIPLHYSGEVQPIDLIDAQNLNFNLGNVVKYCCRQGRKESALEDLKKAQYYLNREIQKLENK